MKHHTPVRTRNNGSTAAGCLSVIFAIVALFVITGLALYVIAAASPIISTLG